MTYWYLYYSNFQRVKHGILPVERMPCWNQRMDPLVVPCRQRTHPSVDGQENKANWTIMSSPPPFATARSFLLLFFLCVGGLQYNHRYHCGKMVLSTSTFTTRPKEKILSNNTLARQIFHLATFLSCPNSTSPTSTTQSGCRVGTTSQGNCQALYNSGACQ